MKDISLEQLRNSVVLITKCDSSHSRFGTGFAIHRDKDFTYLLTCAHVVSDIGGPEEIVADGVPATQFKSGKEDGLDLAVLRVQGLVDKSSLGLYVTGRRGDYFTTAGFQKVGKDVFFKQIWGRLGEQVGLEFGKQATHIKVWELEIAEGYQLQSGYSGAPVVDEASGNVLAVITYKQGDQKGYAISVNALREIWSDMPSNLLSGEPLQEVPDLQDEEDNSPLETESFKITPGTLNLVNGQWIKQPISFMNHSAEFCRNILVALRPGSWQVSLKQTQYRLGDLEPGASKSIDLQIQANARLINNPFLQLKIYSNEKPPQKVNLPVKVR